MNLFTERFLPLIKKSGKTDAELEKAMGLPRSIIYDWKTGRNKSSYKKYAGNFASYFNVSTDYLLGQRDESILDKSLSTQKDLGLREDEYILLEAYRELNAEGKKQAVIYVTEFLLQNARFTQKSDTDAAEKAE